MRLSAVGAAKRHDHDEKDARRRRQARADSEGEGAACERTSMPQETAPIWFCEVARSALPDGVR